ncbi:MAG: DUF2274 domain-containing protein [Alphaproteobacteria bacterium]|nr:DUF2274 domain-containing protein [Alphaproteobacteria bacterium]
MRLRITPISDEPPVPITLQLPADIHRELARYAAQLARDSDLPAVEPSRLIAPMLERFMKSDRAFNKAGYAKPDLAEPFG